MPLLEAPFLTISQEKYGLQYCWHFSSAESCRRVGLCEQHLRQFITIRCSTIPSMCQIPGYMLLLKTRTRSRWLVTCQNSRLALSRLTNRNSSNLAQQNTAVDWNKIELQCREKANLLCFLTEFIRDIYRCWIIFVNLWSSLKAGVCVLLKYDAFWQ
jgi:hypothetical protein